MAVLGGGIGAVAAAFELTRPELEGAYEVTLYEESWALGGKGASGRDQRRHERIVEHGLHMWFGFYENAFRAMRQCYAELDRPANAPLSTWDKAFKARDYVVFTEHLGGEWIPWGFKPPPRPGEPGDPDSVPGIWEMVTDVLRWMEQGLHTTEGRALRVAARVPVFNWDSRGFREHLEKARGHAERGGASPSRSILDDVLEALADFVEAFEGLVYTSDGQLRFDIHTGCAPIDDFFLDLRRLLILLDLGAAIVKGVIEDQLLEPPYFDRINKYEFRAWLKSMGSRQYESAPIRALYSGVFAYQDGDPQKPELAAGVALTGALRMFFGYKGAMLWEMQAGMGDTVFAPFYEVLAKRGVRFEFFSRVTHLGVDADTATIESIDVERLVSPKGSGYEPLFDCKGLPCFPEEPFYAELQRGDELEVYRPTLNRLFPPDWTPSGSHRLIRGEDFDHVVLGISLGALPSICSELVANDDAWKTLLEDPVKSTKTVHTIGMQLWLNQSFSQLGWEGAVPVLGAFALNLDTWAGMNHLIRREGWPRDMMPKALAYHCGSRPGVPESDQAAEDKRVRAIAQRWLDDNIGALWPKAVRNGRFDTSLLVAPKDAASTFDYQVVSANITPSDRYVLSIPGTIEHRIDPEESGFNNLWLAGDWVRGALNVGCIECATMGGLAAARGLEGRTGLLPGELD